MVQRPRQRKHALPGPLSFRGPLAGFAPVMHLLYGDCVWNPKGMPPLGHGPRASMVASGEWSEQIRRHRPECKQGQILGILLDCTCNRLQE